MKLVLDFILLFCGNDGLRPDIPNVSRIATKLKWHKVIDFICRLTRTILIDDATVVAWQPVPIIRLVLEMSPELALGTDACRIAWTTD